MVTKYECEVGEYDAPVKVRIEFKIVGDMNTSDYSDVANAIDVIESIARKYERKQLERNENAE